MKIDILKEVELRLKEEKLIEMGKKLEAKPNKTGFDYLHYLTILKELKEIQNQICDIKENRKKFSSLEMKDLESAIEQCKLSLGCNMVTYDMFKATSIGLTERLLEKEIAN